MRGKDLDVSLLDPECPFTQLGISDEFSPWHQCCEVDPTWLLFNLCPWPSDRP